MFLKRAKLVQSTYLSELFSIFRFVKLVKGFLIVLWWIPESILGSLDCVAYLKPFLCIIIYFLRTLIWWLSGAYILPSKFFEKLCTWSVNGQFSSNLLISGFYVSFWNDFYIELKLIFELVEDLRSPRNFKGFLKFLCWFSFLSQLLLLTLFLAVSALLFFRSNCLISNVMRFLLSIVVFS